MIRMIFVCSSAIFVFEMFLMLRMALKLFFLRSVGESDLLIRHK